MPTILLNSKTMPSKPNSKVDFRDLDLKNQISKRYPNKSEGLVAKRDLKRYYAFIDETLKKLNLDYEEARILVLAFKDKKFDEDSELLQIQREIIGAVLLGEVKLSNSEVFIAKVKSWKPHEVLAITDAVERFWHYKTYDSKLTTLAVLNALGII